MVGDEQIESRVHSARIFCLKDNAQRLRLWAKAHSVVVKKRSPTTFEVKNEA
ncbi:MAG: hypothetical protein N3B10_05320 [Armatimonadetes bacterium]|nr:hypothetical protein [Armatimonadota bacterium]